MPDKPITEQTDAALLRRLGVLAPRIKDHDARGRALFDERHAIWRELDGRQVERKTIAEASGVTPMAIGYQFNKPSAKKPKKGRKGTG